MKNNSIKNKGFTLVEMIVSIAIFMIVSLVAIGAFLKIIDLNTKSHTLKDSIANMNFVMDSISRELRTGTNFYCPSGYYAVSANTDLPAPNCTTNSFTDNWSIYFYSPKTANRTDGSGKKCRLIHAYSFSNESIYKAEQSSCDGLIAPYPSPYYFFPVISNDGSITFSKATMKITRDTTNIYAVPFVQFHFVGTIGKKERTKTAFDLQTGISQRVSD